VSGRWVDEVDSVIYGLSGPTSSSLFARGNLKIPVKREVKSAIVVKIKQIRACVNLMWVLSLSGVCCAMDGGLHPYGGSDEEP